MLAVFREVNVDDLYALIIFPVVAAAQQWHQGGSKEGKGVSKIICKSVTFFLAFIALVLIL